MVMVLPFQMGAMGYKNVEYLETKRPWLSKIQPSVWTLFADNLYIHVSSIGASDQ